MKPIRRELSFVPFIAMVALMVLLLVLVLNYLGVESSTQP